MLDSTKLHRPIMSPVHDTLLCCLTTSGLRLMAGYEEECKPESCSRGWKMLMPSVDKERIAHALVCSVKTLLELT